jgi:hypothetical protein
LVAVDVVALAVLPTEVAVFDDATDVVLPVAVVETFDTRLVTELADEA